MKFISLSLRSVFSALVALGISIAPAISEERGRLILPETAAFPESIAIDKSGGIYTGSVTMGNIVYISADGTDKLFVRGGTNGAISIGGLLLSNEQDTLYACSSDLGLNGFSGSAATGLLAFSTSSGELIARWDFPGGGLCNDIAQAPDGTLYVSDSFVPRVLKLPTGADAFETFLQDERFSGEGFNLSGITLLGDSLILAKFNTGQFFRVDLANGPALAQVIQLDQPIFAPDGLRTLNDDTILVAAASGQIARLRIDGLKAKVIPQNSSFDGPTSLALHEGKIYVVEGQLNKLPAFDPSAIAPNQFTISIINQ
ncbi:hypothetical protein [uncultured Maritalea sp.]|jgi:sugar lactone lactonase YvrE|uniref:SMP-30/gluconolactonase/LRE family protein n=1 Tax=uncultured Maritalea sp. TaxID=757249 RepID=UPI00262FBCB8|nr:hypothetical protein [uncultured Maritalea sp.]